MSARLVSGVKVFLWQTFQKLLDNEQSKEGNPRERRRWFICSPRTGAPALTTLDYLLLDLPALCSLVLQELREAASVHSRIWHLCVSIKPLLFLELCASPYDPVCTEDHRDFCFRKSLTVLPSPPPTFLLTSTVYICPYSTRCRCACKCVVELKLHRLEYSVAYTGLQGARYKEGHPKILSHHRMVPPQRA